MADVLVVDDSPIDRMLIDGLLKKDHRMKVTRAASGADALAALDENEPDLIVTDLQMPEMDGLELVTAMRIHFPHIPVVLITAHGSEELAVRALEQGAASYVPKSQLARNLLPAVDHVLEMAREKRGYEALAQAMDYAEFRFRVESDLAATDRLVELVQQLSASIEVCDCGGQVRLGMALEEALRMAILRGNLELNTESLLALSGDGPETDEWLARRRAEPTFCDRRVRAHVKVTPEEVYLAIVHEGPPWNFDERTMIEVSPSLESPADRSLVLMRAFMDEVTFCPGGRSVTLIKRKAGN